MDELVELALRLRDQCRSCAEGLSHQFCEAEDTPPISAFNIVHNHATMTAELLHYYKFIWSNKRNITSEVRERLVEENGQRVMEATKHTFISCLSAIEFSAKKALNDKQNLLVIDWTKRVYLNQILKKSQSENWIDDDLKKKLDDMIFFRNCLVHNNGIADEDRALFHPEGKLFQAKDGQMLQNDLKLFLGYACFACDAFRIWSESFLTAKQCA